jgi:hypothetical protein
MRPTILPQEASLSKLADPALGQEMRPVSGIPWPHVSHFRKRTKGLRMNQESTLSGWWVFAGVLLLVAGVLNIIYGIAAIGDSKFFTENATYIISGLHTWGWILLIIGVLELVAAFSLFSGGEFGRWFGIFIGSLNAIGALLSIPAYPFWSLAIFALSIIIIYKLAEGPEGTVS